MRVRGRLGLIRMRGRQDSRPCLRPRTSACRPGRTARRRTVGGQRAGARVSLRVRVFAGVDPVTGRHRYLSESVKGVERAARRQAQMVMARLQSEVELEDGTATRTSGVSSAPSGRRSVQCRSPSCPRGPWRPSTSSCAGVVLGATAVRPRALDRRRSRLRADRLPAASVPTVRRVDRPVDSRCLSAAPLLTEFSARSIPLFGSATRNRYAHPRTQELLGDRTAYCRRGPSRARQPDWPRRGGATTVRVGAAWVSASDRKVTGYAAPACRTTRRT